MKKLTSLILTLALLWTGASAFTWIGFEEPLFAQQQWSQLTDPPKGAQQYVTEAGARDTSKPLLNLSMHKLASLAGKVGIVEGLVVDSKGDMYILDRRRILAGAYGLTWYRYGWYLSRVRDGNFETLVKLDEKTPVLTYSLDWEGKFKLYDYTVDDAKIAYNKDTDEVVLGASIRKKNTTGRIPKDLNDCIGLVYNIKDHSDIPAYATEYYKTYGRGNIGFIHATKSKVYMYVAPTSDLFPHLEEWLWAVNVDPDGRNILMDRENLHGSDPHPLGMNFGDTVVWGNDTELNLAYMYAARGIYRIKAYPNGQSPIIESETWVPVMYGKNTIRAMGYYAEKDGELYYTRLFTNYLYRQDGTKVAETGDCKTISALFPSEDGWYVYDAVKEALYELK